MHYKMKATQFFVGREEETTVLQSLLNTSQADLAAIIGRRRIGKTYLVKHAFKGQFAFHITGVKNVDKQTMESSFYSKGSVQDESFQIDMLIDRSDNAINLCEMKFYATEYELSRKEAEKLHTRREMFRAKSQTTKYLINTLITTFGLKANEHSASALDKVLRMEALFL
jgi:hypothetical protein